MQYLQLRGVLSKGLQRFGRIILDETSRVPSAGVFCRHSLHPTRRTGMARASIGRGVKMCFGTFFRNIDSYEASHCAVCVDVSAG
ncbi:MAG: hypothetical protein ACKPKO_54250, partial [Candidatus Fonsibacter sp.]